MIEAIIQRDSTPRQLTIVSDDRRLKEAARRRQCPSLGCLDYLEQVAAAARTPAAEGPAKPQGVSAEETRHWLEEFGDLADDPGSRAGGTGGAAGRGRLRPGRLCGRRRRSIPRKYERHHRSSSISATCWASSATAGPPSSWPPTPTPRRRAIQAYLFGGKLEDDFESGLHERRRVPRPGARDVPPVLRRRRSSTPPTPTCSRPTPTSVRCPRCSSRATAWCCLSNTNELHARQFRAAVRRRAGPVRRAWCCRMRSACASRTRASTSTVGALAGRPAGECLFIDDLPSNVEAARACGWQGDRLPARRRPAAQAGGGGRRHRPARLAQRRAAEPSLALRAERIRRRA